MSEDEYEPFGKEWVEQFLQMSKPDAVAILCQMVKGKDENMQALMAQIETMRDDYEEQAGSIPIDVRMQLATLTAEVELLKAVRDGLRAENEALKKKLWASGLDLWDDE